MKQNIECSVADDLKIRLQDPEFKAEYNDALVEMRCVLALAEARKEAGLTQQELADKTGMTQGDISKIENGARNISIETLQRLAQGLGKTLQIRFV